MLRISKEKPAYFLDALDSEPFDVPLLAESALKSFSLLDLCDRARHQ